MKTKHRTDDAVHQLTTPQALEQWREAERLVAVARRGRLAAEAAAAAAGDAQEAATATSIAARAALASMTLAEESASKTATAARVVVSASQADLADAQADEATSEVSEGHAHREYTAATERVNARDSSQAN